MALAASTNRNVVQAALAVAGGEMTQAAVLLGVSRRVLYNITDRLEIRRRRRR